MKTVRKNFEIKASDASFDAETGLLIGAASVTGVMDEADDVIFPGVYTPILAQFLTEGFVALSHDWAALPVAMPQLIEERGRQLYTEAVFHSTQAAQDVRTVCAERLAAGKSIGLSVGFMTDASDYVYFESGANLLQFARANGYNMALFDTAGISAFDDWCCGIIGVERLIEYSVTPIPCNRQALISGVKGADGSIVRAKDRRTIEGETAQSHKTVTIARQLSHRTLTARLVAAKGAGGFK